jgi:hypothetical protein
MTTQRLYFASHVLPSGKVWVLGGEYSGSPMSQNITATGEIYDPVTNIWTAIPSHPEGFFGDDPSMLMSKGKILAGSIFTPNTYLYDYNTNTWNYSPIPKSQDYADRSDEESWTKLADGRVLTYDIFASVDRAGQYAEIYDPVATRWSSISPSDGSASGSIPALSSVALGYELGPIVKVRGGGAPGTVFVLGATGHTALYSPTTNTWKPGPDIQGALDGATVMFGAADAPAAVLPNGHVLFAADASPVRGLFNGPTRLFDYDPVANTISTTSQQPPDSNLNFAASFVTRMLVLPTGEVLFGDGGATLWVYTPDGQPQPQWRPVFADVKYSGAGNFTLQGVNMNGASSGSSYGDDVESDENYPIVRIQDKAGHVTYGRTTNWSSTGVGQAVAMETVSFTLPRDVTTGSYLVTVSGAGISSLPRCVNITADQVSGVATASNVAITCGSR